MASYQYPPMPVDLALTFAETTHADTYPAIDSAKADLSGKIVYITGASKGIGRATAISFAKSGAEGIAVCARSDLSSLETDIQSAALAAGKKAPKVLALKVDVGEQESIESATKEIEKVFGRLDILVNNAGYLSEFELIAESDPVTWWLNWELNLKGVYLVTRSLLPLMLKGGEKTIVNIASIGGLNTTPGGSGYQISKNAVLRFTEFLCVDYANQGILAYSIHPGAVKSDLGLRMPEAFHPYFVDEPQLAGDTMVSLTSTRREWLAGRYISANWNMPELYDREVEIVKGDKLKMKLVM